MSGRESLFSLSDLRRACGDGTTWADVDDKRGPMAVVTPETVLALVEAVEAAQESWKWIDAVARSVDDHALAHGATVARQALSIKLLHFEESVSTYGR